MKEITQETRAKIFALYWGQEIAFHLDDSVLLKVEDIISIIKDLPATGRQLSLLLTPLSAITDEDAIEIAKICGIEEGVISSGLKKDFRKNLSNDLFDDMTIDIADFLRSRGYALPAFGFTVDELVEVGVFKLKQ